MKSEINESRQQILSLLAETRQETHALLSQLDPDRVIHTDERAWRVRDIIGHLGIWNEEAASSLNAYANGREYHCIQSEAMYYEYNGLAADERKAWSMQQVWAEYENAHEKLKQIVVSLPDEKWGGEVVYPWNERGTVEYLIRIMMAHEKRDHCDIVIRAIT